MVKEIVIYLEDLNFISIFLRVLMEVIFGGIIGSGREREKRPAGLRTQMCIRDSMRAVYRNPKEVATKLKDLIDLYLEDLLSYEKLETTVVAMIKANDDRIYKNGFMPTKLIAAIGEERKVIVDKIAADNNLSLIHICR